MPTGDRIQMQLSSYAAGLAYERLDEQTVHAAKVRIIDTIGALVGGFAGEPCRIAREVAVQMPNPHGASVIGTNIRTSPDVAAFVNGTTARYVEMNDVYHWPGSAGGHPSDVLMPIFAAAEHARASGRDFLTACAPAPALPLRIPVRQCSVGPRRASPPTWACAVPDLRDDRMALRLAARFRARLACPSLYRSIRAGSHESCMRRLVS